MFTLKHSGYAKEYSNGKKFVKFGADGTYTTEDPAEAKALAGCFGVTLVGTPELDTDPEVNLLALGAKKLEAALEKVEDITIVQDLLKKEQAAEKPRGNAVKVLEDKIKALTPVEAETAPEAEATEQTETPVETPSEEAAVTE